MIESSLADPIFNRDSYQWEPLAGEICEGARKILAILVELRMEARLKICLEKSLTDSNLPVLENQRLLGYFPESALQFQKLQWEYAPLKFQERSHKDLDPACVLPFVENAVLW